MTDNSPTLRHLMVDVARMITDLKVDALRSLKMTANTSRSLSAVTEEMGSIYF